MLTSISSHVKIDTVFSVYVSNYAHKKKIAAEMSCYFGQVGCIKGLLSALSGS